MAGTGSGEARSVYVVQRAFRHVRRGYDPEEVDRHLQLVSEWFRSSSAGREAEEVEARLADRERALDERERALESDRLEVEGLREGVRLKAQAEAAELIKEAEAESERLLTAARAAAERLQAELREQAERDAEEYVQRRQREIDRLVTSARERRGP